MEGGVASVTLSQVNGRVGRSCKKCIASVNARGARWHRRPDRVEGGRHQGREFYNQGRECGTCTTRGPVPHRLEGSLELVRGCKHTDTQVAACKPRHLASVLTATAVERPKLPRRRGWIPVMNRLLIFLICLPPTEIGWLAPPISLPPTEIGWLAPGE